jgi:opacity protein-like surface antigen
VPFAAGGIGAARFTPSVVGLTQETRWAFSLGGGVRIPIVKHVRLRLEARGYLTWLNGSSSLFCSGNNTSTTPCAIQAKGQTLFQYDVLGGVSFGF